MVGNKEQEKHNKKNWLQCVLRLVVKKCMIKFIFCITQPHSGMYSHTFSKHIKKDGVLAVISVILLNKFK